jgi:hypothetical protein
MVGRLRLYMSVVSAMGFVALCLLAANVDLGRVRGSLPESAMLALVVLAAPFLSIPLSRDGPGPSVHVDAPFSFALVLAAGPGAAALVVAASCALYDLAHRKPLHKLTFNIGTHVLGLAGGAAVWIWLAGGQATGSSALPAILTGTTVFVVLKVALFAGVLAVDERVRRAIGPGRILRQSVLVVAMAQVGVLVLVLGPSVRPCCCSPSARSSGPTCCCAARPGRCRTATTPSGRPGGRPSCGPRSRRSPASSRRPTR